MKTRRLTLIGRASPIVLNLARTGMPAADSIHDASRAVSARGRTFRILRTTEVDEYEKTPTAVSLRKTLAGKVAPAETAIAALMKKKPSGDQFAGTSRKAAKLSIASGSIDSFTELKTLIESLLPDDKMATHKPKIKTTASSGRVKEENTNIKVKAFLYAPAERTTTTFT